MSALTKFLTGPDRHLFVWINRRIRCGPLDKFMAISTMLGSTGFALAMSIILLAAGKFSASNVGLEVAATLALSQLTVQTLKRLIDRPRPYMSFDGAIFRKPPSCRYSFPSGHTCAAFAIALPLASAYPVIAPFVLGIACMVGLSRIYLGFHYPTDVLAGFAIVAYTHSHLPLQLMETL